MQYRLILIISSIIFSLSFQKIDAQQKKKFFNENILTEVKIIQKRFSDSVARYDYKKDSILFSSKYRQFYSDKIDGLKNLHENLYDKHKLIGKYDSGIFIRHTEPPKEDQKPEIFNEIEIREIVDADQIENYQQVDDLRKSLPINFPFYLFEDGAEDLYKCILTYFVDVDGKFKRIGYSGENIEFNLISALYLYAIEGFEKPLFYNKKPLVRIFAQPITLNLQ